MKENGEKKKIKFISGFSALYYWNIPYLDDVFKKITIDREKTEYTVNTEGQRYRKKGEIIHLCRTPLPEGSVVGINGTLVATPELAFLQVANRVDILTLILLGMQLCSHPPGHPEMAITSKEKLTNFIVHDAFGHRGRRKAMRAVKYIANGSNSIMESLLYILMTAPYILGGFLLKGAILNYLVELAKDNADRLMQSRCYLDLCYDKRKIGLEYDSSAHHSSREQQNKDRLRGYVLTLQGYEILHLTTQDLYSEKQFKKFARKVANKLGKRIRVSKNNEKFTSMHSFLRSLLPTLGLQEVNAY